MVVSHHPPTKSLNREQASRSGLVKPKAPETLSTGELELETVLCFVLFSKVKSVINEKNGMLRWIIGEGAINDFAFSPCSKYMAVVSQDGCLRVFNYDAMELIGLATSYFGGLLCVCWSPDGHLVVAGGEDDLVTVWSFQQRRIVARGQGHRSWITVVWPGS